MRVRLVSAVISLCMPAAWCQAFDKTPFEISGVKTHTEALTTGAAHYTLEVGGTLDMDNTTTREHGTFRIAFQNNESLTIANTGDVPVVNPRVITNGRRRWVNVDDMLSEFTQGARDRQDLIYLVWENVRQNCHHDSPTFRNELHDPVRFLNVHGSGLCDDSGRIGSALFHRLGFNEMNGGKDPFVRCMHGHMMCEVFHDGDFQFIDIDQDAFFLDRENRKPVSGDAAARDHDLVKRELPYGPVLPGWDSAHNNASLMGIDDGATGHGLLGFTMDYTLRPGERIEFRWDEHGKYAYELSSERHRYYSTSRLVYEPPLGSRAFKPLAIEGFQQTDAALVSTEKTAQVTLQVATCYVICGGLLRARFESGPESATYRVDLSLDGKDWTRIWENPGKGAWADVSLDEALGVHGAPPRRVYYLRLSTEGKGVTLSDLSVTTDILAAPLSLPRLKTGKNIVEYMDDTRGTHEVTVTHAWRECGNVTPPTPPEKPVHPAPGACIKETYTTFAWPAVRGCDAYHIRVSRRPDFAYPYRPNYDVIVPATSHHIPWRGMFSQGETYYWRVRPRLASGVWGGWSPTWTFTWEGPMVPRDVTVEKKDADFVLSWQPNPRGMKPVRYDIYGSDERGFSVSKEPYETPGLGEVPANFLASTAETRMVVVSPDATQPAANRAYYRVVAVDERGVESCPSDYVELPHPYVYTEPKTEARVGQAYAYPMRTLSSIGDYQFRYIDPKHSYREREAYTFELAAGPAWLKLDAGTGLLSGTPGAGDTGAQSIEVRVVATYPDEVPRDSKSGREFQKRRELPEAERSCVHRFELTVQE